MTTAVRSLDLDDLTLQAGGHSSPEQGLCVMEAVAYMAGEKHSDMPQCVSPVLRAYGMRLNDSLPDDQRQALKQFVPALIGTAGDGLDQARRDLAQRTVMTEWLPQWLRLAGLKDLAVRAEQGAGLPPAELRRSLNAIRDLTWEARKESRRKLTEQIKAEMAKRQVPAAAAAVAVADAAAAAVAVFADAVAVAAFADAVAAAVGVGVGVAVADAVAAADADAVAVAAADAAAAADAPAYGTDAYWDWRARIYEDVRKALAEHIETSPKYAAVRGLRDTQLDQALDLYARMIAPSRA